MIHFTSGLKKVYEQADYKGRAYIESAISHYINEFTNALSQYNEASLAFTLMGEIDRAQATNITADAPVKCKKGCAFCCHINVDMTLAEAQVIVEYCRDNGIAIDERVLKIQEPLTVQQRNTHKQNGCVFLAADNTCKIYPVRPLACRKHLVVSKPKRCDTSKGGREVQFLTETTTEILLSAFASMKLIYGNMSQTLLKALAKP